MYIHLGTEDTALVGSVYSLIREKYPEELVLSTVEDIFAHEYKPGQNIHILSTGKLPTFEDTALERWYHLYLSSRGARFWTSDAPEMATPTHAGVIKQDNDANKIVTDAVFAELRAAIFQTTGVNYIGRTYGDPRTAILVDYKKDKTHNPTNDAYVHNLLTALPDSSARTEEPHYWGNFAIVSTTNVDKLAPFVDELSETDFLAYSPGAVAKLTSIGRDFGKIDTPRADKKYGLVVRETASRMRPEF